MTDLTTLPIHALRTSELPDLGAVTDDTALVAEHAGSGTVLATALRTYVATGFATTAALTAETDARTAADVAEAASRAAMVSAAMAPVVSAATLAAGRTAMSVLGLGGGALTGPLTSAQAGAFGNTQMNIGTQFILNGLSPTSIYQTTHTGNFATIGLMTGVAVPAGTAYEADAFAAYITNSSTTTGASAGSFYALNLVAGAVSWGTNILVDDQGHASTVVGVEFDIGSSNPGSTAIGCNMLGVFPGGVLASSTAYQVSIFNSPWQWGFVSYDGACQKFALVGAAGATANSDGQVIQLNARDNSNTVRICGIQAIHQVAGADLALSALNGLVRFTTGTVTTGTAEFDNAVIIVAGGGVLASLKSGATQVGTITTDGATTAYNTTSDYRLKITHGPASVGSKIDAIPVYDGEYVARPGDRRPMLLGHELAEVCPWAVSGVKDAIDEAGGVIPQMVDFGSLVPMLLAELKSLRVRCAALEARP